MALLPKKTTEAGQLEAARAELAKAQSKLDALAARESVAATSADRWGQWTAERDAAAADVARLIKLVAAREATAREAARLAAELEQGRQVEAFRTEVERFADRLENEAPAAMLTLMTLARDEAALVIEARRLTASLPPGTTSLIEVGTLRDLPTVSRQVIATEIQDIWVTAGGIPVGDQDAVIKSGDGTGELQISRGMIVTCFKRKFRSTKFRPAFTADAAGYFFSALRLPFADRPGEIFDGSRMTLNDVATMNVQPPALPKPALQPIRTELTPIDPPAGATTMADRNVSA